MATVDQIDTLRRYIAEPDSSGDWSDETLSAIIDSSLTLNDAAIEVWDAKAAAAASLVDISEGGSSRKNSDVLKNAQAMAALFRGRAADAVETARGTTIKRLSR